MKFSTANYRFDCGILQGFKNALRLQFDDWLCSEHLVRCTIRWTIAVLSNFGRHWLLCNKPKSYPKANVDLHLPYSMKLLEKFHYMIRAHKKTLSNDVLLYDSGMLDNVDIYLRNDESEIELSNKRLEALQNMNTKQVLYFLALIAQNGDTDSVPMEATQEEPQSSSRVSPIEPGPSSSLPLNASHQVPLNQSSTDSFLKELTLPDSSPK